MGDDVPTKAFVAFLNRTIDVHWQYHAMLMLTAWFVVVPIGVVAIRFFKPKPTTYGIERGTGRFDPKLVWWTIHYSTLYAAAGLALAGMLVAIFVSGKISRSAHAMFGFGTILFGCLQLVSAWNRGTHGGKHGALSDPADPSTWRGDHFDMTPRRRWFEAYHKTAGYFTMALAFGAAGSGLMRFWVPGIAICLGVWLVVLVSAWVVLEGGGFRQDTYRSVYGNHPDNPYNRAREGL